MRNSCACSLSHRLHYRWSQLESDSSSFNLGSPQHPLPQVDRTLRLNPEREYKQCPSWETPLDFPRFSTCGHLYKTVDYNTFLKNGVFKLTEIEVFFLSSHMTRTSSQEWAVLYLGIGNGERFRHVRDEYFPDLSVISFDPFEDGPNYVADTQNAVDNAKLWNDDGTHFVFYVRCFDLETDISLVQEKTKGKKLLLISDIRGCALLDDGKGLDKMSDLEFQWEAIQRLRPVSSLVKFDAPSAGEQIFEYAPGTILKQVFQYYGSCEVRLMIEGVPPKPRKYNTWELYEKMALHHEHLRGLVYDSDRQIERTTRCFDFCFDCEVLWNTFSTYAVQNSLDPYKVFNQFVEHYAFSLSYGLFSSRPSPLWESPEPDFSQRWWIVEEYLQNGRISEAIGVLEGVKEDDTDWARIFHHLFRKQPCLAWRLKSELPKPASRDSLIQLLGCLSKPVTLISTDLNSLDFG
jgi:hypothetical protein